jgi:hypothetical protein
MSTTANLVLEKACKVVMARQVARSLRQKVQK